MSKLLQSGVSVVVALGFMVPVAAFGLVDCSVTPTDPTCVAGNGSPLTISMPWGLTGGETPTFAPGTSVKDAYGNTVTCPWWFPPTGCYDITKTAYYRTAVLGIR